MDQNIEKILAAIETLEEMQKGKNSFRIRRMLGEAIEHLYFMVDVIEEEK